MSPQTKCDCVSRKTRNGCECPSLLHRACQNDFWNICHCSATELCCAIAQKDGHNSNLKVSSQERSVLKLTVICFFFRRGDRAKNSCSPTCLQRTLRWLLLRLGPHGVQESARRRISLVTVKNCVLVIHFHKTSPNRK